MSEKTYKALWVLEETHTEVKTEAAKRKMTVDEYVAHGDKLSKVEAELRNRRMK